MSNISANIIVETNPISVQVEQSEVGITVEPINLNIYSAGFSNPGGNIGQLQYNAGGVLGGVPNTSFSGGNLTLGNVANVKITGGSSAYYLQTDGSGTLTWAPGTANITGNGTAAGSNNAIQLSDGTGNFKVGPGFNFNPTSNVLDVPGNATANYFIGNFFVGNGSSLTAINGSNVTGTVANATNAITATTANAVAGANVSGAVAFATTANAVAGANVSGAVALATYATIANSVAGANVSGAVAFATTANAVAGANVSGAVANATFATTAGTANAVAGANVSGQVGNALVAGTVYTAAQPNITSLGSLTGLEIVGPLNVSSNTIFGNLLSANIANITGNVNAANFNGNLNGGAITGTLSNVNGTATLSGLEIVGNTTLTGTGFVQQVQEKVTVVGTAAGANYNYNLLDQVVIYNTASANANLTLNFRGNSSVTANTFISNSKSTTATYLLTNGVTAYAISNVQIDGSTQTIRWAGNTTPNVYVNTIMSYTFNLIKTGANTYTVLGSATRFG